MYSKFGQFIEGKWQSSEKKETYDVINPATEERIYGQTVALDL
jgi:succinate-semialdehyde dehydrogenase/glutarate-semialdehyde dehydrogenase